MGLMDGQAQCCDPLRLQGTPLGCMCPRGSWTSMRVFKSTVLPLLRFYAVHVRALSLLHQPHRSLTI